MTAHEYDLAVRAVIGLAGCAVALVAIALDWREQLRFERWRDVALGAIAEGEAAPDWRTPATTWTTDVNEQTRR